MKYILLRTVAIGTLITLMSSLLVLLLVQFKIMGPAADLTHSAYKIGGTILFLGIYLFLFFGIYWGLIIAKKFNEDKLTFRTVLLNGGLISLSTAISSVLTTILLYEVFYPDYAIEMGNQVQQIMESNSIQNQLIQEKKAATIAYYQTFNQAKYAALGNLMTGLFYSVLLGVFLKK